MTAPTAPEPAAPAFAPAGRRWRARVGMPIVLAGLLLVVASAFLPWVEVHRQFGNLSNDDTYRPWDLPIRAYFPLCVGVPLPFVLWAALRARAGRRRMGSGALVALCGLGALGAWLFTVAGTLSTFSFLGHASVRTTDLVGWWCCLVGFGVLALGSLILGRAPARSVESPPS
jgi:hypothetical protein